MTLKDLLKKKDKVKDEGLRPEPKDSLSPNPLPEFTFLRTTTTSEEVIAPPTYPGDRPPEHDKHHNRFRRHSNAAPATPQSPDRPKSRSEKRLSERLHIGSRSRAASTSSVNIPADLPEVGDDVAKTAEDEARWEKRATLLAKGPISRNVSSTQIDAVGEKGGRSRSASVSAGGDENIQEAIRLHEAGELEQSTKMFGRLAEPDGANNALSQVLYGLALRHGWGCEPNPEKAITYLSYAASNSADIESLALNAGMKKGGAAKGELVLAIFELANCFRHGWGVKKDAVAAKQYYETAANLGDTDAMVEIAWCYQEGFGCKKDKFKAAQYLRLAEEKGNKILGNTWIWKEKYDPKPAK